MLVELQPGVYYWRGGVNFGLVVGEDRQLVLIDAGLDASAPRKALRPFLEQGYRLAAVIATHCHTDHIGGAAELRRRFGCAVYAPAPEHLVLEHPELASMWLYGAYPPPTLQVKFLQPQAPCPVTRPLGPGRFSVAGLELELVPVPGHSPGGLAVAVSDVLFAGDGIFMPEVLAKHTFLFMVQPEKYLESLQVIAGRGETFLVPGHGDHRERRPGADPLPEVVTANLEHVRGLQQAIKEILQGGPSTEEGVLRLLARQAGKQYDNDPSYYLDRVAVSSHLAHLAARGEIEPFYSENSRAWTLVEGHVG